MFCLWTKYNFCTTNSDSPPKNTAASNIPVFSCLFWILQLANNGILKISCFIISKPNQEYLLLRGVKNTRKYSPLEVSSNYCIMRRVRVYDQLSPPLVTIHVQYVWLFHYIAVSLTPMRWGEMGDWSSIIEAPLVNIQGLTYSWIIWWSRRSLIWPANFFSI